MGGRYIISGAQIGEIRTMIECSGRQAILMLGRIVDAQFIGNSDDALQKDKKICETALSNKSVRSVHQKRGKV